MPSISKRPKASSSHWIRNAYWFANSSTSVVAEEKLALREGARIMARYNEHYSSDPAPHWNVPYLIFGEVHSKEVSKLQPTNEAPARTYSRLLVLGDLFFSRRNLARAVRAGSHRRNSLLH